MRNFSPTGQNLLCTLEGFEPNVYPDTNNIPTIGIGTTIYPDGTHVAFGDPTITKQQALSFAYNYISKLEDFINTTCQWNPTQNQFDALVCFLYNVGLSHLNGALPEQWNNTKQALVSGINIPAELMTFCGSNNILKSRRLQEINLFNT